MELQSVKRDNTNNKDDTNLNHHEEIVFCLRKFELTLLFTIGTHNFALSIYCEPTLKYLLFVLTRSEMTFQQARCTLT